LPDQYQKGQFDEQQPGIIGVTVVKKEKCMLSKCMAPVRHAFAAPAGDMTPEPLLISWLSLHSDAVRLVSVQKTLFYTVTRNGIEPLAHWRRRRKVCRQFYPVKTRRIALSALPRYAAILARIPQVSLLGIQPKQRRECISMRVFIRT
jgi:hypothetical protein